MDWLTLPDNSLTGTIPTELGLLSVLAEPARHSFERALSLQRMLAKSCLHA